MVAISEVFENVVESFAFDDTTKRSVSLALAKATPEIESLYEDLLAQRRMAQEQADRSRNGSGWDQATPVVSIGIFDL